MCICRKIKNGRKTKQERKEAPMFQTVVELHSHDFWHVYTNVSESVDALLAGQPAPAQSRKKVDGRFIISMQGPTARQPCDNSWGDDLFDIHD